MTAHSSRRRVKARSLVKFTRRRRERWDDYGAARISFGEFDASVQT